MRSSCSFERPFIRMTRSHPAPAAARNIVPKFPGSRTLSHTIVTGIESAPGSFSNDSGSSNVPVVNGIN